MKIETSKFMELQSELASNVLDNVKREIESLVHAKFELCVVDGNSTSYTPQGQEMYNRVYDEVEEILAQHNIFRGGN